MKLKQEDIANAREVYQYLLWMPILAYPATMTIIFNWTWWIFHKGAGSFSNWVVPIPAVLFPLFLYLPVFFWASSPKPYLQAHARQGVILLLLRCFSMYMLLSASYESGGTNQIISFFFCSLIFWLVGSIGGLVQAGRGHSFIGRIKAEIIRDIPPAAKPFLPTGKVETRIFDQMEQKTIDELRLTVEKEDQDEWSEYALQAARGILAQRVKNISNNLNKFRNEDSTEREDALREMERLGQVETF